MSILSAWTFEAEDGASTNLAVLSGLVGRGEVEVWGAAALSWRSVASVPRVDEALTLDPTRSPGAEFWGLLFGVTYAVPLLEATTGRIGDEPATALGQIGVDVTFTHKLRDRLVPGSSVLLVLSGADAADRLRRALDEPEHPDVISVPVRFAGDAPPDSNSVTG